MTHVLPNCFFSGTDLKLDHISVTLRMVKKVITDPHDNKKVITDPHDNKKAITDPHDNKGI